MGSFLLNDGMDIPILGLGTYKVSKEGIVEGIKMGYRHLDTATGYNNHQMLAQAIKETHIPREHLFIVTKINLEDVKGGLEHSLKKTLTELSTDYVDALLIHAPDVPIQDTICQLERFKMENKVKTIGVSNFNIEQIQIAQQSALISINQIEFHPYYQPKKLLEYCQENGILVVAYRPLGAGKAAVLQDPLIIKIARKYDASPAQICLRWLMHKKIAVIPKASSIQHLKDNIASLDFTLDHTDIMQIDVLGDTHHERTCVGSWLK